MRFSLDVIRARKGDCLMVHYGTKAAPRLMMIDGGPSEVYKPHLRPRIEKLRADRGLDDHDSLQVDVLMVSHVDDDHIKGILDLTKELRTQKANGEPRLIRVRTLWHNCFDDLLDTTPEQLKVQAGFGAAALNGEIDVDESSDDFEAAKVLASIPQGRTLRDDAEFLRDHLSWKLNEKFAGGLIITRPDSTPVTLDGGLTCTVIGPMQAQLQALQEEHDTWLREQKKHAAASSTLAAFVDKSVPNLSSIVVLAELGGKRMLLTGDARGDKILQGFELAGLIAEDHGTMHVDVLKVPHHGSSNNMETSFFARITADHYVFSGNGEHGNPERETLEMLFTARGTAPMTLYLTYPIDAIDVERKKDWEKEQAKEIKKGKTPRPDWQPKKNSLRSFLDDNPLATGQRIVEIADGGEHHHVIDLLDPL
ncbi:MAG TPA: hypothetical protein VMS40_12810 [Vicinamibacterales bacterium]|nr:hypothetical protein [Vicinamibacterales bacterium]